MSKRWTGRKGAKRGAKVMKNRRVVSNFAARVAGSCQRLRVWSMDELDILFALLESELDDDTLYDETFDLERDDTREVTVVIELEDQWTQPYEPLAAR
jgi:hypothetical protein